MRSGAWAVAADRFAREIVCILKAFPARARQLNTNPFGAPFGPILIGMRLS